MRFCLILITALFLAGCSHHKAPPPNARLSDSITVIAGLNDQLQSWHGTPYRYGGMTRRGVDCSGFVVVTMRDRFDLQLPRETKEQASIGTQIDKDELLLVTGLSKRVRTKWFACRYLRYQQPIYPRLYQQGSDAFLT